MLWKPSKRSLFTVRIQHFDESIKGSLEVGKLADFVILDKNPLDVPKENLKDIKVLQTIKEDKIIYSADPQ